MDMTLLELEILRDGEVNFSNQKFENRKQANTHSTNTYNAHTRMLRIIIIISNSPL